MRACGAGAPARTQEPKNPKTCSTPSRHTTRPPHSHTRALCHIVCGEEEKGGQKRGKTPPTLSPSFTTTSLLLAPRSRRTPVLSQQFLDRHSGAVGTAAVAAGLALWVVANSSHDLPNRPWASVSCVGVWVCVFCLRCVGCGVDGGGGGTGGARGFLSFSFAASGRRPVFRFRRTPTRRPVSSRSTHAFLIVRQGFLVACMFV